MSLPKNVLMFVDGAGKNVQHDPADIVDYLLNLDGATGLLEAGEHCASYTLTVRPEAAALGVGIGASAYAPTAPSTTQIKFWLEVDPTFASNAAFDGDGMICGVEVTVTTDNTPPRIRQRTVATQVAQQ